VSVCGIPCRLTCPLIFQRHVEPASPETGEDACIAVDSYRSSRFLVIPVAKILLSVNKTTVTTHPYRD